MPSMKGKMRKVQEDESDSDESFHCCGRPEDLLEDARSLMEKPEPQTNEVHVPDDQAYYLYSAGLERLNSPSGSNGPKRRSLPSIHESEATSSVYSADTDSTRIGSPLLIIKTGEVVVQPSVPEISPLRLEFAHPNSPPTGTVKPRSKPKWTIQIPRPRSFIRMAISPTDDSPRSPRHPLSALQASSAPLTPPTPSPLPSIISRRRRGMILNPNSLPDELKELAETQCSDLVLQTNNPA
ncbi:hypothetical protein PTTG_00593 [Puccinia triticina 1-1 BBBD Race 1]|uniref:Uncharacterized protein n=1 Tax=Puccinia triticina (isolate 1-1 / race 1 (BBBD)) TaxID=630390 RepID=A0A180G3T0_PUCT1|nr:hypothetical protein PTTG_00593 [Puccinia triticina 1-1 BBBD Race 1]